MPEEDYEIRGAHEEAVEEGAHHGEPLSQKIALFSAILATLGAIVSFLGGHTQNDALYYKNEAVLMKARASDSWSYYQAEDVKRHLALAVAGLQPGASSASQADASKYETRARASFGPRPRALTASPKRPMRNHAARWPHIPCSPSR